MKFTKLDKNKIFQIIIGLLTALLLTLIIFIVYHHNRNSIKITMGGQFYKQFTDSNDYKFVFFQLTNDTDIEIAQYKKDEKGNWNLIKIDPEKCLKKKSYGATHVASGN